VKIFPSLGVLLCFFWLMAPVSGQAFDSNDNDDEGEINSAVAVEGWISQAAAKWQISFPYVTGTGQTGVGQSRLDFKRIDSPVILYSAGGKVAGDVSFDVLYGTGTIRKGHGVDTDRFKSDAGGGVDFSQSTNDLTGNVQEWGINVYYNNKRYGAVSTGPWGMVVGYSHYSDSLRMTNGFQSLSVPFDNIGLPATGPFAGLNSTFDFTWDLLRVGALYQPRLTEKLSLSSSFAVYPYVKYEGDGYWNLRAGTSAGSYRVMSPNFIQSCSKGYGYDASLGLTYAAGENIDLTVGYRYFYLYAGGGTETVYFANGAEYQDRLDWVTVTRQGAYAAAVFKF
jgi:hypothetical protein